MGNFASTVYTGFSKVGRMFTKWGFLLKKNNLKDLGLSCKKASKFLSSFSFYD